MIKRDYVLALIEESTRALASLVSHTDISAWSTAQQATEDSARSYLGLTLGQLKNASALDLISAVHTGRDQDIARWHHLVGLLHIQGTITAEEGEEQAVNLYFKALDVATEVSQDKDRLPYFLGVIESLRERVSAYIVPAGIQRKLFYIYEHSDQYASAENILFDMLEESHNDDEIVELGLDFYDRLLIQSDFKLQVGGLPRAEIDESLAELLSLKQHAQ